MRIAANKTSRPISDWVHGMALRDATDRRMRRRQQRTQQRSDRIDRPSARIHSDADTHQRSHTPTTHAIKLSRTHLTFRLIACEFVCPQPLIATRTESPPPSLPQPHASHSQRSAHTRSAQIHTARTHTRTHNGARGESMRRWIDTRWQCVSVAVRLTPFLCAFSVLLLGPLSLLTPTCRPWPMCFVPLSATMTRRARQVRMRPAHIMTTPWHLCADVRTDVTRVCGSEVFN